MGLIHALAWVGMIFLALGMLLVIVQDCHSRFIQTTMRSIDKPNVSGSSLRLGANFRPNTNVRLVVLHATLHHLPTPPRLITLMHAQAVTEAVVVLAQLQLILISPILRLCGPLSKKLNMIAEHLVDVESAVGSIAK